MPSVDDKELWVRFAAAAIEGYDRPDNIEETDEVADDVAELCGKIADSMLDEYHDRFDEGRRRRRKPEPEPEEEEEEEEP